MYVEAGDADALAGGLHRVLTDQELSAELSARGRGRSAVFTWERTADGLIDLYTEASAARRSALSM